MSKLIKAALILLIVTMLVVTETSYDIAPIETEKEDQIAVLS